MGKRISWIFAYFDSLNIFFCSSRIDQIENRLEFGFEKILTTITEIGETIKRNESQVTLEQLNKCNQLDRLPCMCCEPGSSFDKAFLTFSKDEENDISHDTCKSRMTKASSYNIQYVSEQAGLLPMESNVVANTELLSFTSNDNLIEDKMTSTATADSQMETSFLLGSHSVPMLSQDEIKPTVSKPKFRLRPLESRRISKSLPHSWLDRLISSNRK